MKSKQKVQSAVQMIRNQDSVNALIESIGQRTAETERARLEAIDEQDSNVFDMNNLLDVKTNDGEFDQPMLAPVTEPRDLNAGEKAQVVEELAKLFKRMPGEIVDLEDLDVLSTVVETKLGTSQSLKGFIKDLISGAADHQNSQQFAKGTPVPGLQTEPVTSDVPYEKKAPTEVTPVEKPVEGAPGDVVAPIATDIAPLDIASDVSVIAPEATEPLSVPSDITADVAPAIDAVPDVAADVDAAITGTEIPVDVTADVPADVAPDVTEDIDLDFDKTPATDVDHEASETPEKEAKEEHEASETPAEEKVEEEAKEDETPDEDDEIDAQLESIKAEFNSADRAKKVSNLVESILKQKSKLDAQLEATGAKFHAQADKDARVKATQAKLESIVAGLKKEKAVQAKLESIIGNFKKTTLVEAAKCSCGQCDECAKGKIVAPVTELPAEVKIKATVKEPAAQMESDTDAKLAALVENYKGSKQSRLEAIENRSKARKVVESLTK